MVAVGAPVATLVAAPAVVAAVAVVDVTFCFAIELLGEEEMKRKKKKERDKEKKRKKICLFAFFFFPNFFSLKKKVAADLIC